MHRVFERDPAQLPDGIVSANDMFTQGILAALRERGIVLNQQVRVASLANKGSSALIGAENDLYLFEADPGDIVQAMFTLLEAQMDGNPPLQRTYIARARARYGVHVAPPGVAESGEE
ncbi:MAG: hypothetical protein OHK0029_29340 [Armatimonadaceae bacterium]